MPVEALLQKPVQGRRCFGMPFGELCFNSYMNDGVDLWVSPPDFTTPMVLSDCVQTVRFWHLEPPARVRSYVRVVAHRRPTDVRPNTALSCGAPQPFSHAAVRRQLQRFVLRHSAFAHRRPRLHVPARYERNVPSRALANLRDSTLSSHTATNAGRRSDAPPRTMLPMTSPTKPFAGPKSDSASPAPMAPPMA